MNWRDKLCLLALTQMVRFDQPLEHIRAQMDIANRLAIKPRHVRIQPAHINAIDVEWYYPDNHREQTCVMYLHGGAYVAGGISSHRAMLMHWAKIMEVAVCSVEYRLAPEHPFPAGLDDAMSVYQGLLAQGYPADKIVIGGDSAGGGLALATLLRLRDEGIALPAGACLIAPWTNPAESDDECRRRLRERHEPWLTEDLIHYREDYAGATPLTHPYISPLLGDMHGLPPLCIHVGEHEFLFEDAQKLADKARAAGVMVEFKEWKDMWHVFHALVPISPTATIALRELGVFVHRVLNIQ